MAKSADILEQRRADWHRLEQMLQQLSTRNIRNSRGEGLAEVSTLYRSTCADLAMAEQYRLSPETVSYLHALVGKAHNTIYRSRRFQLDKWWDVVFTQAPQQIFQDRCVHICAVLFFGLFALSTYLAYNDDLWPGFAERMVGSETIHQMESSYAELEFERDPATKFFMVSYYIQHNTSIGLKCFALGPLIIPGLFETAYNATVLGACFGYMARPESEGGEAFLEFVTAHGAFELTAIALAAAAGLRIGTGWLFTHGLTRGASLQLQAQRAIPIMAASAILFFLAAFTEGLLSPSNVPYIVKALWGIMSSTLLMFYFVVLGYPREAIRAT
ncbi:MAG: stage II sporulation protein M [Pirellulaceae bacterium]